MAIFGSYETTQEIARTGLTALYKAKRLDRKLRHTFLVKVFDPQPGAVPPDLLPKQTEAFFNAASVQQKVANRSEYWAPIHDVGTTPNGAYLVTDAYPFSADYLITARIRLNRRGLHEVTRGVVKGLLSLKQLGRRAYGNLKPANVLLESRGRHPRGVVLTDPLPDEALAAEGAELADLQALGMLIYALVMHKQWRMGTWPIPSTPEWKKLGRKAAGWLEMCNKLLDMDVRNVPTLEQVGAMVSKLRPRKSIFVRIGAPLVVLGGLGYGGWYVHQYHWNELKQQVSRWMHPSTRPVIVIVPGTQPASTQAAQQSPATEPVDELAKELEPVLTDLTLGAGRASERGWGDVARYLSAIPPRVRGMPRRERANGAEEARSAQQAMTSIDTHWREIQKDRRIVDSLQDPLRENFPALLQSGLGPALKVKDVAGLKALDQRLGQMETDSAELAKTIEAELPKIDQDAFVEESPSHAQLRKHQGDWPLVRQWIAEAHDGRYAKLKDTDDPRRGWNGPERIGEIRARLSQVPASAAQAAQFQSRLEAIRGDVELLSRLKWGHRNQAQIRQRRKELDGRLAQLSGQIESAIAQATQVKSAQQVLEEQLASAIPVFTDASVESQWQAKRRELLDQLHKEPGRSAELSKQLQQTQAELRIAERTVGPINQLIRQDRPADAIAQICRLDPAAASVGAVKQAQSALASSLYDRGQGLASKDPHQALKLYLLSACAGNAQALKMLERPELPKWGPPSDADQVVMAATAAADAGKPMGMTVLGQLYASGWGVKASDADARRWFEKAAGAGEAVAAMRLFDPSGKDLPKDPARAYEVILRAANANIPAAQYRLGKAYQNGEFGRKRDPSEAARWFARAADAEYPDAMVEVARLRLSGTDKNFAKDAYEAVRLLKLAAKKGNTGAMRELGRVLLEGKEVAHDYQEAYKWNSEGARRNDLDCMFNAARCLQNNWGTAQDVDAAVALFRRAAEAGDVRSMKRLAVMYESGSGAGRDLAAAASWYKKAADKGDPAAMCDYGRMCYFGIGTRQDYPTALACFRKAAEQKEAEALLMLGIIAETGHGNAKDPRAAFEYFRQASALEPRATTAVGEYIEFGVAVNANADMARQWYEAAAKHDDAIAIDHLCSIYPENSTRQQAMAQRATALRDRRAAMTFTTFESADARAAWLRTRSREDSRATLELALMNVRKEGVNGSLFTARALFEHCMEQQPAAKFYLAGLHHDGSFGRKNPELALKLLTQAADAGEPRACIMLGMVAGKESYLQKAADAGDPDALFLLGLKARKADPKRAFALFRHCGEARERTPRYERRLEGAE